MTAVETEPILTVHNLVVRYDDTTVLAGVDLAIEPCSVMVLTGPPSGGKTTLVRALTGALDDHPGVQLSGQITYRGPESSPYRMDQTPKTVLKSVYEFLAGGVPDRGDDSKVSLRRRLVRLLSETEMESVADSLQTPVVELAPGTRARLRLLRAMISNHQLVCLDEPAQGLDDDQSQKLMAMILHASQQQAILMVTHNQRRARQVGDQMALLCGGQIVEQQSVDDFFATPDTDSGRQYVRTGSCSSPSASSIFQPNKNLDINRPAPKASPHSEDSTSTQNNNPPTVVYRHPTEVRGPRGFRWLLAGQLGSSPIPGAVQPIHRDLAALERIGVILLVSLTEQPLPEQPLQQVGLDNIHFPIVDTEAPAIQPAASLCAKVARWLHNKASVVFHCRAGMGRAGTMLCSMLIWAGHNADCALHWARTIYDRWVQTRQQEQFLHNFHQWLADNQPRRCHRDFIDESTPHCSCP